MAEDKVILRLEKVESVCESNDKRISDLEIDIKDLYETHLSLMKISNAMDEVSQLIEQQNKEEKKVELIEQPKPNLVEEVIDRIAWMIIGGGIVYLLSRLFGGAL